MQSILRNAVLGLALATFAASATSVSAQSKAKEPVGIGTWKLNVEKSKFSPGPAPQRQTVTFEPAGQGVHYTSEGVSADGKPTAQEYTTNYDGKDVPIKGSPVADTISMRRINALTTERTDKKAGKVVQTIRREVAKDGKSFTATVKGKNAKGEPVNHKLVYEKQ